MDATNPYELLGVEEDASFEEVRDMRDRLLKEAGTDQVQLERIEAAYESVLQDRLRARIEGKIKVPDRIRFAEKSVNEAIGERGSDEVSVASPSWLTRVLDNPDKYEVLRNFGIFGALGVVGYLNGTREIISICLAIALIASFYLLYQKEHRFGRTFLLTAVGIFLGATLGYLGSFTFPNSVNIILMSAILFFLWLVTTFLR